MRRSAQVGTQSAFREVRERRRLHEEHSVPYFERLCPGISLAVSTKTVEIGFISEYYVMLEFGNTICDSINQEANMSRPANKTNINRRELLKKGGSIIFGIERVVTSM